MSGLNSGSAYYFQRARIRPHSDSSQEAVSPHTNEPASASVSSTRFLRQARVQANWRTCSDSAFPPSYRHIPTIDEEAQTSYFTPAGRSSHKEAQAKDVSEGSNSRRSHYSSTVSLGFASSLRTVRRPQFSRSAQSSPAIIQSECALSKRKITGEHQNTFARGSWAGRATLWNTSSSPSSSVRKKLEAEHVQPVVPLRPPIIADRHNEVKHQSLVRVEKSFTGSKAQSMKDAPISQPSRNPSLLNPRELISASIRTFRRLGKRSSNSSSMNVVGPNTKGPKLHFARDHQTSLQKQHTSALLLRVASLLKNVEVQEPRVDIHYAHDETSDGSCTSQPFGNAPTSSLRSIDGVKSVDQELIDTKSTSSSSSLFGTKATPYNTPQEQAKYVVVNQKGEPEEYLKVDISIRGRTSYLPSEARRIHTPPLYSKTREGKRRGFFFDYNLSVEQFEQQSGQDMMQTSELPRLQHRQSSRCSGASYVPTISKACEPKSMRSGIKSPRDDWYAQQLADVDSMFDGRSTDPDREVAQSCIHDRERFDYNIPEHLPTSPLCPRHPRYWRVVKHKGSQFRGCWMHGFHEFDKAEKAKYGILDAKLIRKA